MGGIPFLTLLQVGALLRGGTGNCFEKFRENSGARRMGVNFRVKRYLNELIFLHRQDYKV